MQALIVFSHLRWDFVFQRPQHLLSRLANHYQTLFFEEPIYHDGPARMDISTPLPNLTVLKPHTPINKPGFHDEQMPYLKEMLRHVSDEFEQPLVWFYTPMALPLLDELSPRHIVYDCMDELSAFKNPPMGLIAREEALLRKADIVFTGGPSLYEAKKNRHPNVHCFSSSVDIGHFRQALDRNIAHPSQQELPRPRLGFYGVIDERLDADLVAKVAQARPDWQLVLVGPVVKIDPAILPRYPNVHYMGQQAYQTLPQFLAAWDVCLMPFAMNESTRFISPTKSLEYMAAELPIVSTPVKDVVDQHSDVVEIATDADDFIAACDRALNMSDGQRQRSIRLMRDKLARTSWDATAAKMLDLLEQLDVEEAADLQSWMPADQAAAMKGKNAGLRQ